MPCPGCRASAYIKARADLIGATTPENSPLTCVVINGYSDPTRILVRAGADIDVTVNDRTAEHWANQQGHHNIATFLADIRQAGGYEQYSELFC